MAKKPPKNAAVALPDDNEPEKKPEGQPAEPQSQQEQPAEPQPESQPTEPEKVRGEPFAVVSGNDDSIAADLPGDKSLISYARKKNQDINQEGYHLSCLYRELGIALNRLKEMPKYGAHGEWEKSLATWGIDRTRATKAMAIADAYGKPEQLQGMSVEKAYKRGAEAKREEKASKKSKKQSNPEQNPIEQEPTDIVFQPAKHISLYCCPFSELEQRANLQPGTIKLICTDPPWCEAWLPHLDELGAWCKRMLADDGVLVCRYGSHYLNKFFPIMDKHLFFRWQIVELFNGGGNNFSSLHGQWIPCHHPIQVYSKTLVPLKVRIRDVIAGGVKEKQHHKWQWAIKPVTTLVDQFSSPGSLIVDPCAGSGTCGEAALSLGRKFIGCDSDPECRQKWEDRFADYHKRLYDDLHEDATKNTTDESEFTAGEQGAA